MVNQTKGTGQSIYSHGADDGFWIGIYLSVMCVAMFYSVHSALSGIATLGMALAVPFIIFFLLRRSYRADNCRTQFSGLWLHGICIFFFASLLMALTAYIYLRFIEPSYINNVVSFAKEFYSTVDTPDAREMVTVLQRAQDTHSLPAAGSFAVSIIWAGVFSGSVLSMILSMIIRATTRPTMPPPPPAQMQ